jgi:hypothetical protein
MDARQGRLIPVSDHVEELLRAATLPSLSWALLHTACEVDVREEIHPIHTRAELSAIRDDAIRRARGVSDETLAVERDR